MASQPTNHDTEVIAERDNLCVSVEDPRTFTEYATESETQQGNTAESSLRHSLVRDLLASSDAGHVASEPPTVDSLEPEAMETKRKRKVWSSTFSWKVF